LVSDRYLITVSLSKEASAFLKKRAAIEEEYGKAMIKIAKGGKESYYTTDFKRG
jgi:hypothetical protein